jgi:hypothetical protein
MFHQGVQLNLLGSIEDFLIDVVVQCHEFLIELLSHDELFFPGD